MNNLVDKKNKNLTVVKLITHNYKRGNSYISSKSITTLKRKSCGFNILNDCVSE